MVDRELAKGIRVDSLFMGIRLGMTQKEFFAYCWEMNKQGIFTDGPGNMSVEYEIKELKYLAFMHFYPDFYENKIYKMPVKFSYKGWAPWNKQLFADSLQLDVLRLYKKWYGDGFIKITNPDKGDLYVKVDGNRRIIISRYDDLHVMVMYADLLLDQELQKNQFISR